MSLRSHLLTATALIALPVLAHAGDLSFAPVPFAADDAAKRAVVATDKVTIDGKDFPIAYHLLARTGDKIGLRIDIEGVLLLSPIPERLRLSTSVDLDSGRALTVLEDR